MIRSTQHKGFTLIEILVALAIFAVIGVVAASCLHQMIAYRTRLTTQANQWRTLAIARLLIQKDFTNAINLNQQDVGGALLPIFNGQSDKITLTRWNHVTAAFIKNSPLFVGVSYHINDKNLMRATVGVDGKKIENILLENVEQLKLYYLNPSKLWVQQWSANGSPNERLQSTSVSQLPQAIRIIMKIKGIGTIQWDFTKPVVSG